jgi:hypothetical protein
MSREKLERLEGEKKRLEAKARELAKKHREVKRRIEELVEKIWLEKGAVRIRGAIGGKILLRPDRDRRTMDVAKPLKINRTRFVAEIRGREYTVPLDAQFYLPNEREIGEANAAVNGWRIPPEWEWEPEEGGAAQ